eukprot:319645-Chlamydomonas_euryale.AAC.1
MNIECVAQHPEHSCIQQTHAMHVSSECCWAGAVAPKTFYQQPRVCVCATQLIEQQECVCLWVAQHTEQQQRVCVGATQQIEQQQR